jgi:hypothetical protein
MSDEAGAGADMYVAAAHHSAGLDMAALVAAGLPAGTLWTGGCCRCRKWWVGTGAWPQHLHSTAAEGPRHTAVPGLMRHTGSSTPR